ncbi:MAG TPA: RiPP maturation radical SAM C-methyltransferase [Victivallales bacterium]|nr:RiPP maturation radical SAM C-methyltransferase [Victivallales bacterium]
MHKIILVNMPFAKLNLPSLGLLQLKAAVDEKFGDNVCTEIIYPNIDFVEYFGGVDNYLLMESLDSINNCLGEWFFRPFAFPDALNNNEDYFERYYSTSDSRSEYIKKLILDKRNNVESFFDFVINKYKLDSADVIGFTSIYFQNSASYSLANKLKSINPHITTVMGGTDCCYPAVKAMAGQISSIDYFFSGNSLVSFSEFLNCLFWGEEQNISKINGIFPNFTFDKHNKAGYKHVQEPDELDLNINMDLDYAGFLKAYKNSVCIKELPPILTFRTSCGCWWGEKYQCSFCGIDKGEFLKYKKLEPRKAIKQFCKLFEFSSECKNFFACDMIMPHNYPKDVFFELNVPNDIEIFYETRANLSLQELQSMAAANIKFIQPGIESFSSSTLKLMNKGTTAFSNIVFLKKCLLANIGLEWNLLIGTPGELESSLEKLFNDLPLLAHLYPPQDIFPIRFDRNSDYFINQETYNLVLRPFDSYYFAYPFPEETINDIAYSFSNYNPSTEYWDGIFNWGEKLQKRVSDWKAYWSIEKKNLPQLYMTEQDGKYLVFDTRTNKCINHKLTSNEAGILKLLNENPLKKENILKAMLNLEEPELNNSLQSLHSKKLLFEEDNTFLGLALIGEYSLSLEIIKETPLLENISNQGVF